MPALVLSVLFRFDSGCCLGLENNRVQRADLILMNRNEGPMTYERQS